MSMSVQRPVSGPLFIVFEGIDGSGKSTLARETFESLIRQGTRAVFLSEPTRGKTGLQIRELLSSPVAPDPDTVMRLFVEDREDDVRENITPALERGEVIIMDRYYHSNAAYQGASGLSYRRILKTNIDYGFPRPDRVFLLDCSPETALERIARRNSETGTAPDNFERMDFLASVASLYKEMADETFILLNGENSIEENLFSVLGAIGEITPNE